MAQVGDIREAAMDGYASHAEWLESYKRVHAAVLENDPSFRRWLDEEYVPLAGGWHY